MPELKAIVSVDFEKRIQCMKPGCGHSVYRRVHVVEDAGQLLLLGSTCFAKLYGGDGALGEVTSGVGDGRTLTDAERQTLVTNTQEFLWQLKAQQEALAQASLEKLRALRQAMVSRHPPAPRPATIVPRYEAQREAALGAPKRATPVPWMRPMSSMAYFKLRDGSGWLRVQHRDGRQVLMPYPSRDGWDEALPPRVGTAAEGLGGYVVADIVPALAYLRQSVTWEKVSGIWRELLAEIRARQ